MTRYLTFALAAITCGCASLSDPETTSSDKPALLVVKSADAERTNTNNGEAPRSTVPMTDEQKDSALDAVARALHVYWFFGSR